MLLLNEVNVIEIKKYWLGYLENKVYNIEEFNIVDDFFKLIETSQSFGSFFNRPNKMTYLGICLDGKYQTDIIIGAVYSKSLETESLKIADICFSPRIDNYTSEKNYLFIIDKIMDYSKKNMASSNFKIFFHQTTEINYFDLIYDPTELSKLQFESTVIDLSFFGRRWFSFEPL